MQPPPRKVRVQLGDFGRDVYKGRGWGAPSPFPQGAVTAVASGLVTGLPPVLGGGHANEVSFRRRGGPGSFPPPHGRPPDVSQEFRVCICVCARARQCCSLQSAFSGLHRGEAGSPCSFAEPVLVWLFSLRQVWALQLHVATLAHLVIFREFVSSLAVRFGLLFPRGGRKEVGLVTAPNPRGKREIKPPPPILPRLSSWGARGRWCCPGRARTGQCIENRAVHGVCTAVWAWGGSDGCSRRVSGSPPAPYENWFTVLFPRVPKGWGCVLVFLILQMVTQCLLWALGGEGCSVLPSWANICQMPSSLVSASFSLS